MYIYHSDAFGNVMNCTRSQSRTRALCGQVLPVKCRDIGSVLLSGMSGVLRKGKNRGMTIRYFTEDCREVRRCA